MKKHFIFLTFLVLIFPNFIFGAYLRNIPVKKVQPDGAVIQCFASGDEFYNWLHDENNYTIVKNPETGYYVYAIIQNEKITPSEFIVGRTEPESLNLEPGVNIFPDRSMLKSAKYEDIHHAPKRGNYTNIVIFIRFADQPEFNETISEYDEIFNGSNFSLKGYFNEISGNQLNVSSTFYPLPPNNMVVSYQDEYIRDYYVMYDQTTNPIGYKDHEETEREHTLLANAINAVKSEIENSNLVFDSDEDGYIDNICFIIQGSGEGWSNLLWPHKWNLYTREVYIGGKRVSSYNFQLSDWTDVSVLCHEMFHTLGAPDLYHYSHDGLVPVGAWDLMAWDNAQHTTTWMKYKYGNWFNTIPEITSNGSYKLPAVSVNPFACYKIPVPESETEFFMLEYRKKTGYDSNLYSSYDEGLLVYRIDPNLIGNRNGPPDEIYVLRPGVNENTINGFLGEATFSDIHGRISLGPFSDPLPQLSDGTVSSLNIYDIETYGDTLYFKIGVPEIDNSISVSSISPASPAILEYGEKITVNFDYTSTDSSFYIFVYPRYNGSVPDSYSSGGSPLYQSKEGSGSFWLQFENEVVIDEILFQFQESGTYNLIFEKSFPVNYTYTDSLIYSLKTDSLALVAFFNTTNGPNWTNNTNWLTGPVDTWYGVTVENGRVFRLALYAEEWEPKFGLSGNLPSELGNLTALRELYLQQNELTGQIPSTFGNLTNLEILNIKQNQINGYIPKELGNLINLIELNLWRNNLSGEIPVELNNLKKLQTLWLGSNNLSGDFGSSISGMDYLYLLDLRNNNFEGEIPEEVWNLTNLELLLLGGNNFEGEIPLEISNLVKLYNLDLSQNGFSGEFPKGVLNLPDIIYLNLSSNKFSGKIPENIGNLNKLWNLNLGNNNFEGELPVSILQLTGIAYLYLYSNKLTGEFPDNINNLNKLRTLMINDNHFEFIPDLSILPNLSYLFCQNNKLTFCDIEPNIGITDFRYFPQDIIGQRKDTTIHESQNFSYHLQTGGEFNQYQWYKDGTMLTNQTSPILEISSVQLADAGEYFCEVTNTVATDLTLTSRIITLTIDQPQDCPQHFYPGWAGNGFDQMNINILSAQLDGMNLQPGDEIGIFDGDICVGYGKVSQTIGMQNILSVVVSRDDGTGNGFTQGNNITYKFWDCSASSEYLVQHVQYYNNQLNPVSPPAFDAGATAFVELAATSEVCQTLDFSSGWNLFSVPVYTEPTDMLELFQPLITNTSLVKIQDETGKSLENWGIFGGWQNNIGDIVPTEGYKIKVDVAQTLEVCGTPVEYPFAVPLYSGWNITGYPQTLAINAMDIVQQLIDRGALIKVQDEKGNSIENWGIFGGWQNNIGNFVPGQGYKIKVNAEETLTFEEAFRKSAVIFPETVAATRFKPAFEGNGVDHMNINLTGLPLRVFSPGDELAVFDGELCVGATTLMPHHLARQAVSIAVSAADGLGMPGFSEGNVFTLKLWSSAQNREYVLEPEVITGTTTFLKHESTLLSLENYAVTGLEGELYTGTTEIKCYPNPFSEEITFEINLAENTEVQVEVYNQMGQRVKILSSRKHLTAGTHRIKWDGKNSGNQKVAPGIYYVAANNNRVKIILIDR